jgi:hypothetical protein
MKTPRAPRVTTDNKWSPEKTREKGQGAPFVLTVLESLMCETAGQGSTNEEKQMLIQDWLVPT